MAGQPNLFIIRSTAVLLVLYLLVVIWALASPSNDPQRGMAQGFLMFVLVILATLGGLLWLGTHPYRPVLVWILFLLCAYPAVMLAAQRIFLIVKRLKG